MDSDYDLYDVSDVESLEGVDDECEFADDESSINISEDQTCSSFKEKNCSVLSEADIKKRLEDDISGVSLVLSVSRADAAILLRHYSWRGSRVHEEWFADEEKVRKAVGLVKNPIVDNSDASELTCGICFDTILKNDIYSSSCGHPYCSLCWAGYIGTAINDGSGCLMLHCPDPSCDAAIGQDMVDALCSKDDQKKYLQYLQRSYIEDNREMKWCPAPGCVYAVNYNTNSECYDVMCSCSYGFCWNCTEEAHRPVNCETVSKWILKNSAESENTQWILAYTKPCPKCQRPIEKNMGCMHMTCTPPCKFEFCWICLEKWSKHGYGRSCNGYVDGQKTVSEADKHRELAKKSLEKYAHYYERWAANHASRQKAIVDFEKMKDQLGNLSDVQDVPETQLQFILDGWSQIVECRRVLKWTYAYGYYMPEHESGKKLLFEYLQGEAEAGLERLHQCVEKDVQVYVTALGPSEDFKKFQEHLTTLTKVTKTFFENLVGALEKDLCDVQSQPSKRSNKSQGVSKTKKAKASSSSSNRRRPLPRPDINVRIEISSDSDGDEDVIEFWQCDLCTFQNPVTAGNCQMCWTD